MKKKQVTTIEEDIEDFLEQESADEQEFFPSWIKKTFFISMAVFCVLLITSLIYVQYPVANIILGQIHSQAIDTTTRILEIDNTTLLFTQDLVDMMFATYRDNLNVETSLCLEGTTDGRVYNIISAYEPVIFSQSYTHVSHAPCSDETIVMFHTHPYKSCLPSEQDLLTLQRNQELRNPDIVMLIMCEPNRFSLQT